MGRGVHDSTVQSPTITCVALCSHLSPTRLSHADKHKDDGAWTGVLGLCAQEWVIVRVMGVTNGDG